MNVSIVVEACRDLMQSLACIKWPKRQQIRIINRKCMGIGCISSDSRTEGIAQMAFFVASMEKFHTEKYDFDCLFFSFAFWIVADDGWLPEQQKEMECNRSEVKRNDRGRNNSVNWIGVYVCGFCAIFGVRFHSLISILSYFFWLLFSDHLMCCVSLNGKKLIWRNASQLSIILNHRHSIWLVRAISLMQKGA